jgi:hypothetical protein
MAGGYLPEQKFMDVRPALNAFRAGVDDGRQEAEQNLLRRVGQTAASQGLGAASAEAMRGGNVGMGIKLQDLSIDRQIKLYDFMGRGAAAADTPEKWQSLVGRLAQTFGPESVKGFEDFKARESAIMLTMSAKEQAEMALRKRQVQLQEQTARKGETKTVKDAQGNERLVRIAPDGSATPVDVPGMTPTQPTNPYAVGGKMNESQGKAATYADRMAKSHRILTNLEDVNKGTSGWWAGSIANTSVPFMGKIGDTSTFNSMASADRQNFMQAKRDFINAVLRRESGAVISEAEFENADKQYFPQPGDSAAVIQQKRQNRITAMQGIMREAGPGYNAPEIVREPSKKKDAPKLPKGVTVEAALSQARSAINSGAPREQVINRLKSMGVDTTGL